MFLKFSLILMYSHSKNLIHPPLMPQNCKILEDPFEGGIPQCGFPNFSRDLVVSDTYISSKFEFSACSGLKVDKLGRKTEKSKEK